MDSPLTAVDHDHPSRLLLSTLPLLTPFPRHLLAYSAAHSFKNSMFDVPVFWPILLLYWCILFFVTMKRQIMHMIKYKYVPFSFGKKVRHAGAPAGHGIR